VTRRSGRVSNSTSKRWLRTRPNQSTWRSRQRVQSRLRVELRVELLLETDSGYPKDTGVTLFTLATPGNPFHYNIHRSAPSVSALAHSRGPRKRSQSPVDMLEHRDTYGQAQVCIKGHQGSSVDRPCQPSFHVLACMESATSRGPKFGTYSDGGF